MPPAPTIEQGNWRRGLITPPDVPHVTHLVVDGYGFGESYYSTACNVVGEYATTVRDDTPEFRCGACKEQEPIYREVWEQRW